MRDILSSSGSFSPMHPETVHNIIRMAIIEAFTLDLLACPRGIVDFMIEPHTLGIWILSVRILNF